MPQATDLRRAALYMIASALLFAGMSVAVKLASRSLPNATLVFFRNAIGLLALLPWLLRLGLPGLRTRLWREHLVRGLAGLAAMYCFFYTIAHMRLADAVLLNYSLPLFIPLIERFWLGEQIPPRLWSVLGVGFLGLLLILRPGPGVFQPVALFGVAAAALAALAQVGIRRLTRSEPATRIVFYFGSIATLASLVPALASWKTPGAALWGILLALGVLATLAQLLLTRAYACAPAARVGPFIYTSVVFAGLLDWLFWRQLPDPLFVTGALLVAGAGILTLRLIERPATAVPEPAPAGPRP